MVFGRRYRVTEKIGSGGMADVYKAVDEVLGRTVAVKVLHPQYAADANFVARFRQEAQAAANLSHPNIVNIYDWGQDDSTYYIVMEYVRGTDLKTLIMDRGPLDSARAAEYGMQVASALSAAHGYDIIHRDIKPHNIVLTPDGTLKVMDFGIARAGNTTMTQTGSVLGTAQYISPEQAQGRNLTPASDLYSLGVVLYELTTGRLPFEGDTPVAVALKQVNEEPRPPREVNPRVSPAMEAVIMRALRKSPAERYVSASEMREDLKRVAAGQTVAMGPAVAQTSVLPRVQREEHEDVYAPPVRRPVPKRRNPWPWIALVAVLLALAILGAWRTGFFGAGGTTVPDLRGMTRAEAVAELEENGLRLGVTETRPDDSVERGLVVDQDPPAGTSVEPGAEVRLVFSTGVEQVEVPDVSGLSEAQAVETLRGLGLEIAVPSEREFSSEFDENQVIRTEPEAGTTIAKGDQVRLFVSQGEKTTTVPSVVGQSVNAAREKLTKAGLKVSVTEQFNDAPAGRVLSQSPGAASVVAEGATITLVVSKGEQPIKVPDLVDRPEEQAIAVLQGLGLGANVTYQPIEDPSKHGVVLEQDPEPGEEVERSDRIDLVVGEEPQIP